jgi:peptidyl-prolyl cis-trans isomerase C
VIEALKHLMEGTRGRVVAAVVVLLVVGGVVAVVVGRAGALPDGAAFRYDDRVVTAAQLDDRVEVLSALYGVQRPDDESRTDTFNRDAAKSMVVSLVLADAAAERDIEISDKEAQTELDKLIEQQLTGGRTAFVEFLSTSGISERDVLDEIRAQLATSRLVEEVTADVPDATAAEARTTYDEHRDEMVTPEGRRLANIVVESKADADRVAELARTSGDLAPLAKTWSLDGSTRDTGGDLGLITRDQLEEAYAEAAWAAKKDGVFGPVRTTYGWNVGQVTEIVTARPVAYDDVEAEIIERLTAEDKLKVWRDFMTDVLADADVEYADAYLPDDPDAPPADVTPSVEPTSPSAD